MDSPKRTSQVNSITNASPALFRHPGPSLPVEPGVIVVDQPQKFIFDSRSSHGMVKLGSFETNAGGVLREVEEIARSELLLRLRR